MNWHRIGVLEALRLGSPLWVDELGALSLSLFNRWQGGALFVLITVFVDESGAGDEPRILLGAFAARVSRWRSFAWRWGKLLKKNQIPFSHMTAMEKGEDPFQGWDTSKTRTFGRAGLKLVDAHCDLGLTVSIDKTDHREKYRAGMPAKLPIDSAYGICARAIIEYMCRYIALYISKSAKVNFIFERHDHYFGGAELIFNDLKKHAREELGVELGTITPGEKADFAGLQAADVLAFNARRHERATEFTDATDKDLSYKEMQKLTDSKCLLFHYDIHEGRIPLFHKEAEEMKRRKRQHKGYLAMFKKGLV